MEVRGDAGGSETRPYWRLAAERWTKMRRGCVSNEPETKHVILLRFPSTKVKRPAESFTACAVFPKRVGRSTIVERQIVVRFPPHHTGNQHDSI